MDFIEKTLKQIEENKKYLEEVDDNIDKFNKKLESWEKKDKIMDKIMQLGQENLHLISLSWQSNKGIMEVLKLKIREIKNNDMKIQLYNEVKEIAYDKNSIEEILEGLIIRNQERKKEIQDFISQYNLWLG